MIKKIIYILIIPIFILTFSSKVFAAVTTTNVTSKIPTNGLVGYWSFDNVDMSGTTAYDRSGQGNNGTLINSPNPIIGKIGQALNFKASAHDSGIYVSVPTSSSVSLTGDATISLWINPTQTSWPSNYTSLISKRGVGGDNYEIYLEEGTGKLGFYNGSLFTSSYIPPIGKWTHVVADVSGTTCTFYVNGVFLTSFSGCGIGAQNSSPLEIGQYIGAGADQQQFDGSEDEVRI